MVENPLPPFAELPQSPAALALIQSRLQEHRVKARSGIAESHLEDLEVLRPMFDWTAISEPNGTDRTTAYDQTAIRS